MTEMVKKRIFGAMIALSMVMALVPISGAGAAEPLECEGIPNATHVQVTHAEHGDTPVIKGTASNDVLVVDIQERFGEVRIFTYAGADSVCVTNTTAEDLKVDVEHIDINLGSGDDYLLFFSPIDSGLKLDISSGFGNDKVVAPMPLYNPDDPESKWSDEGGSSDQLVWLPMGECGIHIDTDGHVGSTAPAGECGQSSDAWNGLETTLGLVGSFFAALTGLNLVLESAAETMLDFILGKVVTITEAGVDVTGFDKITTTPADDIVEYDDTMTDVFTLEGDDVVYVNHTTRAVNTGAGDDTVWMADVYDADVDGSLGNDTIRFDGFRGQKAETGVTIDLDAETWQGGFLSPNGTPGDGSAMRFENVVGTPKADTIRGGLGKNRLEGGPGADKIYGSSGNDVILGGSGNDTLRGDKGNDSIRGGSGDDDIRGGYGNDWLDGQVGADVLKGQWGDDVLRSAKVVEQGIEWQIEDNQGTDTVFGGSGDDACDFDVADAVTTCEIQRAGEYGPYGYTAQVTDPYGVPHLESRVPNLTRAMAGVRDRCQIGGQIKAELPGWIADYATMLPSEIRTTILRTGITADEGVIVEGRSTTTDLGLTTSPSSIAAVDIRTDRDATYGLTYEISSDYHDLSQVFLYSGELHCNTAKITGPKTVKSGETRAFRVEGRTAGLSYHWDVNQGASWNFAPGSGASSKDPRMVFYEPGTYELTLTATTPLGRTLVDSHSVTVPENRAPTANAGPDYDLLSGSTYRLGGFGTDPDGDPLSYSWQKPGSVAWVGSDQATRSDPEVRFTQNGVYRFVLTVCDNVEVNSKCDEDYVDISVFSFGGPA